MKISRVFVLCLLLKPLHSVAWGCTILQGLVLVMQTVMTYCQYMSEKRTFHYLGQRILTSRFRSRDPLWLLLATVYETLGSWEAQFWSQGHRGICSLSPHVTAIELMSSFTVGAAYVGGNSFRVCLDCFQFSHGFWNQPQYKRNHDNWSSVEFKDIVSAESVLTTTFWIFLHPQLMGLTGHWWFLAISACVVMMIIPVCESDCFFEENDASEKARNLIFWKSIGCILMVMSLCFLALWSTLLASFKVEIVAVLIELWRWLNLLAKSGLVFTDAYCRDPI